MLNTCVSVCGFTTSTASWQSSDLLQQRRTSPNALAAHKQPQVLIYKGVQMLRSSLGSEVTHGADRLGLQYLWGISLRGRRGGEGRNRPRGVCWAQCERENEAETEPEENNRENSQTLRSGAMESENHRYVPIDTLSQKGQYANSEDPCSSGSNGDCGGMSRSGRQQARGNKDALLEDVFYLEQVGQVTVTLTDAHLVWHRAEDEYDEPKASVFLCCTRAVSDTPRHLPVTEIFAVQTHGLGPVSQARSSICGVFVPPQQLHRVEVHTFLRSDSKWVPKAYVFGHSSAAVAQAWSEKIQMLLDQDTHRPKSLLVFVNPYGGKGSGVQTWEKVAPLFEQAKIKMTVVKTERAGHAHDAMERASKEELIALDGVVVVGGDGLFNEVLNGLVMHRHKAQAAIMPQKMTDFFTKRTTSNQQQSSKEGVKFSDQQGGLKQLVVGDGNTRLEFPSSSASDQYPLLQSTLLPSLSEAANAQEGRNVGTVSNASTSGVSAQGADPLAAGDAMVLTARVKESELQGQNNDNTPGYCSISVTVPVRDEQGNFLDPTSATAAPTIGFKRKGEDLVSASGMSLSDIDLEDPNATLVNSNPNLRIGIIPAGSTDTVVISTTGSRDAITSVLHIILGDSMPLDIVRITGWKKRPKDSPNDKPEIRYAASFAGYGFYGDVMKESEGLRWMGPARYDIAGTKVFLKHKSYDAEISFMDIPHRESDPHAVMPHGPWTRTTSFGKSKSNREDNKKVVCRVNCAICAKGFDFSHVLNSESDTEGGQTAERVEPPTWKTCRAKFHSIGAAVMSCRNEKAPDGVAAHAHLADGLLHLILIRECSRPDYLRQLLRLTRRGADPFNFKFVEHYKTPVFTFLSHGDEQSVWNVDGELLPAHQLTGQVFRGLVNLFARGPET